MQGLRKLALYSLLINISIRMDFTGKNKEITQNKEYDGFQHQQSSENEVTTLQLCSRPESSQSSIGGGGQQGSPEGLTLREKDPGKA